jgi:hypothetical protein
VALAEAETQDTSCESDSHRLYGATASLRQIPSFVIAKRDDTRNTSLTEKGSAAALGANVCGSIAAQCRDGVDERGAPGGPVGRCGNDAK